MNILYVPQISMYDKKTGKLIPEADGNINMMQNFINEWIKYRPNDYFYILLPYELRDWSDKIYANRTKLYYDDFVVSARINRFNFPFNDFAIELGNYRFDLIINDVIELSRNFKAMTNVEFGYNPKLISNIRHVDEVDERNADYDYTLRVADGIQCSDYVTILSDSMKDILLRNLENYFDVNFVNEMEDKIEVFEPSISEKELNAYEHLAKIYDKNNKIITFPGRLSDGEEKRTNWDKFFDAVIELRKTRKDFQVYLTDPNNSMNFNLKHPYINSIDRNRSLFLKLLQQTDIIVSLMDIQGFGGISIREALLFGNMPVIPFKHEYTKMMNEKYEGFIKGDITVEKLVDKLNWALDNCMEFDRNIPIKNGHQFTVESQMQNLMNKVEVILNGE